VDGHACEVEAYFVSVDLDVVDGQAADGGLCPAPSRF